jgi:hypothetical protein
LLAKLLKGQHVSIVLNELYEEDGAIVFREACKLGCEGIVSKRLGPPEHQRLCRFPLLDWLAAQISTIKLKQIERAKHRGGERRGGGSIQRRQARSRQTIASPSTGYEAYARRSKSGQAMSERRELYRSPNGDSWFLGREPTNGHAFIIHQPNAPSGGRLSHIELGEFLRDQKGPEQQALLRLIGTLVEVPPVA